MDRGACDGSHKESGNLTVVDFSKIKQGAHQPFTGREAATLPITNRADPYAKLISEFAERQPDQLPCRSDLS
ncbi:hypothetical protein GCM10009569_34690 [Arthrobacter russicus]